MFGLPLRQTTGLLESLLRLAGLDWPGSTGRARLAGAGRQHLVAPSERPEWSHPVSVARQHMQRMCERGPGTGGLQLLIDSTGIKAEGEGEWFAKKHGPSGPRQSLPLLGHEMPRQATGRRMNAFAERARKIHLGIDADTLEIRAVEVTGSRVGPSRRCKGIAGRATDGARLRQAGGRPADQGRNPEPLYSTWNATNSTHGMKPFKGRGRSALG